MVVVLVGMIAFIPHPLECNRGCNHASDIGSVDDRQPIPAIIKLTFHLSAAAIVVMGEGSSCF